MRTFHNVSFCQNQISWNCKSLLNYCSAHGGSCTRIKLDRCIQIAIRVINETDSILLQWSNATAVKPRWLLFLSGVYLLDQLWWNNELLAECSRCSLIFRGLVTWARIKRRLVTNRIGACPLQLKTEWWEWPRFICALIIPEQWERYDTLIKLWVAVKLMGRW